MKRPIYLDYAATTPVDPRVAARLIPYLSEDFGNPASRATARGKIGKLRELSPLWDISEEGIDRNSAQRTVH